MKRAAFSLVELIVVIGLITFLLAITAPALQSSRKQAESVLCSSNIKQLLIGLFTYESENETLPYGFDDTPMNAPSGDYPGNHNCDRMGWWWFNYIKDYYSRSRDKKQVLWCPCRQIRKPELDSELHGNYGVNQSICKSATGRKSRAEFIGTPLRTTELSHPGQTLLIVDSGYSIINWWHAADKPPLVLGNTMIEDTAYVPGLKINTERKLWSGQEQDAINGRHPNKTVNIGFADGCIDRKRADELLVEKTGDTYKNRSPLWLPK